VFRPKVTVLFDPLNDVRLFVLPEEGLTGLQVNVVEYHFWISLLAVAERV
jgi:hypothetical protein